jgi:hypothetical protein
MLLRGKIGSLPQRIVLLVTLFQYKHNSSRLERVNVIHIGLTVADYLNLVIIKRILNPLVSTRLLIVPFLISDQKVSQPDRKLIFYKLAQNLLGASVVAIGN